MTDRVLIGVASIPERAASLEQVVDALAPQADRIAVSLNGYPEVPAFLARHANVEATVRDRAGGDAEKFAAVDDWDGYVATVDDDILYPSDYIARLLDGVERYGRRRAVSFHGGSTAGWTHRSCAASVKRIRCLGALPDDDPEVNVVGTGTLGYHAEHVPVWRGAFRHPNMADVQMAVHGHVLGIRMACLKHRARWLRDICPEVGPRIYEANRDNDECFQNTRVQRYNELTRVDWATVPPRPHVRVSVATCSRPGKLLELLEDLEREAGWVDLEVAVFEDPTETDYSEARALCNRHDWQWHRHPQRVGRRKFWRLVDEQLRRCRRSPADWFVFLPDDVRLVRHAIPRAIVIWDRLEAPSTLTLWRLQAFEGLPSWTATLPVQHEWATETFHVDGLYLCRRDTLAALEFRCPTPARGVGTRSSGVGGAFSRELHRMGRRMYRVDSSLATSNDDGVSIMNPDDRARFPAVAL